MICTQKHIVVKLKMVKNHEPKRGTIKLKQMILINIKSFVSVGINYHKPH